MAKKPVNQIVTRNAILSRIHGHFDQIKQWSEMKNYTLAAHYQAQAQALIELLEIDDCGSSGGYDRARKQPPMPLNESGLQKRFEWLCSCSVI